MIIAEDPSWDRQNIYIIYMLCGFKPDEALDFTQLVMFTEAWTVAANPFLCGVKGNTVVGMCSPA